MKRAVAKKFGRNPKSDRDWKERKQIEVSKKDRKNKKKDRKNKKRSKVIPKTTM